MKAVVIFDMDDYTAMMATLKRIKWEASREGNSYFSNRVAQLSDEVLDILQGNKEES